MVLVSVAIAVEFIGSLLGFVNAYRAGLLTASVYISGAAYHLLISDSDSGVVPWVVPTTLSVIGLTTALASFALEYEAGVPDYIALAYTAVSVYGALYWAYWYGVRADEWPSRLRPHLPEQAKTSPDTQDRAH